MARWGVLATCGHLVLLIAVLFNNCVESKRLPRWWLEVAQRQGPNACVVEEVPGSNKEFWTECRYWLKRKVCGKRTRIRFECCEGFEQIDGDKGCKIVKPLKNILETAESLGATDWANYIRHSGLQHELESSGALTLFAPTNDAFQNMKKSLKRQLDSYRGNPNNPILLYHIVPSKLRSENFDGDMTVETRHQGHILRINKYSNGMTTVNCALITRKDQEATNGLVHIIDEVLDPSKGISNNVADMIINDGRYNVLAEMLEKSGYINVLRTLQDSVTFLAPSDEAFHKLSDSRREKIINDREARLALLQNHVIPHVICESAITGEHRVRTMLDSKLTFNCDITGAYVENTKLRSNFNLGKNGIIHMIDDVLLPDRAKNLVELAESRNLQTFVDLVKKSGLEDTLSHTGDYTFFIPDETAWLEMPKEAFAEAKTDPEFAGLMIRYHGAYGRHLTNAITDNQAIMSLDEEHPVRLQVWRRALGVEDAKITNSDIEAQNGVIHIINRVIFPSNRTIPDILRDIPNRRFETFVNALERITSQTPPVLNLGPGEDAYYTFFVPTDAAFARLGSGNLNAIESDINRLTKVIKSHIAINMFPDTSFEPGLIYYIDGLEGKFVLKKNLDGSLTANGANVLSSHMSEKGVIHIIDDVFLPDESTITTTIIKKVTYTNYSTVAEDDIKDILPAFPQGSVIARREEPGIDQVVQPEHPTGKSISSKKRGKKQKKNKRKKNKKKWRNKSRKEHVNPTLPDEIPRIKETASRPHETYIEEVHDADQFSSRNVDNNTNYSKTVFSSVDEGYSSAYYPVTPTTISTTNPVPEESISEFHTYSETNWQSPYDREPVQSNVSIYRSTSIVQNTSAPNELPTHYISKTTIEKLPGTYSVENGAPNPKLHDPNTYSVSTYKRVNTVGPVSSADKRFTYVGHPYGNDVVGHGKSSALPFSSPGSSYVTRESNITEVKTGLPKHERKNDRVSTVEKIKKINVTETIYSYPPTGVSSTFSFPIYREVIPSISSSGKKRSDSFAAYAFTREEKDFADGTEFAEASIPPEKVIMKEQAKMLRRQWRRKRHHERRRNKRRRSGTKLRFRKRMRKFHRKQ